MLVAILLGFCFALVAPLGVWAFKRAAGPIYAIFPAFLFAYLLQFVPEAAQGRPWRFTLPWDVASGLEVSFRADALSLYFGLILTLVAAASLAATAAPDLAEGVRSRLLVAITALFASAFGLVFADQPVLLVTFSAGLSLSAFLALTAGGAGEARVKALWILLVWLLCDLLLLVVLARLFADVQGGLLGSAGIAGLVPNGRLEPAWLVAIVAAKLAPLLFAMASRGTAPQGPALSAIAGLALPAMLALLLRFLPILPEEGRIGLLAAALVGLAAGGVAGLGARRMLTTLAGFAAVILSAAALGIALSTDAAQASALLLAATGALGLAAIHLLVPPTPDLNLKALRAEIAGTPLGASILLFALLFVAGLVPSIGLLALLASANAALAGDPSLSVAPAIIASGLLIAIAARIGAVLLLGERGAPRSLRRAVPAAAASALLLVGIAAGCAPTLFARLMIGPAVRPAFAPVLSVASLEAWWLLAGALVFAALLFWQKLLFARLIKTLGKLLPAMPKVPRIAAAAMQRVPRAVSAPALLLAGAAGVSALAMVGAAAVAWPGLSFVLKPTDIPALALTGAALIAAAAAIPQRKFSTSVPLVAIAGGLTAVSVLAFGAVELGFVMLLVLVIETIVLLVLSARDIAPAAAEPGLAAPLRLALALVVGAGAALAAFGAGLPQAHAFTEPSGITGLVGATGLALREAGLTAIQRWSGVVVILLVLGVAVADLSARPRGEV